MKKIIEASELPDEEKVYLKKDSFGWRTVEPWKVDGKIKWFNFISGGKRGLFFLVVAMIIAALFYVGINELVSNYKIIADTPCNFCEDCFAQTRKVINAMGTKYEPLNFSQIEMYGGDYG